MRRSRLSHPQPGLEGADGELSLVPYLDILVNLTLFLLFTFHAAAELRALPLDVGGPDGDQAPAGAPVVSLLITPTGYALLSSDETVARVDIPRRDGAYDSAALRARAAEWKSAYSLGDTLILAASRGVEYRAVIQAMDAVREDGERALFPDVKLGAVIAANAGI